MNKLTLTEKLASVEQQFSAQQSKKSQLQAQLTEIDVELARLQGDWRTLNDLIKEDEPVKKEKNG